MIRRQSERQSFGQCNRSAAALWWFRRGLMVIPPRPYGDSAAVLWWLERDLMIMPPWPNDHSTVAEWWFHHGRMIIPSWSYDGSMAMEQWFHHHWTMVPSPWYNENVSLRFLTGPDSSSVSPWKVVGFALAGSLFRLGRQSLSSWPAESKSIERRIFGFVQSFYGIIKLL